jgi:hypothetical protein
MVLAVAACSSGPSPQPAPAARLPLSVGNGVGSQFGNYAARSVGETRGAAGERCVVFDWDRPLDQHLAVRVKSMSCDSKERPGWMIATELSRTIIPIAQSHLRDEADEAH